MADALLGVVFEKSLSLIENEFATLSGLRKKAEKLSKTLDLLRAVLEDAEEKQMRDRAVKVWLQEVKDAAYVLEDILEDCSSKSLKHGGTSSFKPKNIIFRYRVGHKLKEMIERLDKIEKGEETFGLSKGVVRQRLSEVAAERRETSSDLASPKLYGREGDIDKVVVEFLLNPAQSSNDFPSVSAIVGLGGLGKTTLAQMIFDDQRVSDYFPLRIWVCVSEIFTTQRILRSIVENFEGKCETSTLEVMGKKVKEYLRSKRYLLVLDDVWKQSQTMESGVSQDEWYKLKSMLSCGSKGASILVSTRDMEVVKIMGICQAHHLSGLSEDDCWSVFKERAFGPNNGEHAELVAIGKDIVKKCGGSPLVAKALGGVLWNISEENKWLDVKDSDLWNLPGEKDILPALRLSYFHLTPTSRQCFAFCAIFPKDTEIMKEDLIHLWMANGFISSQKKLAVEEVGNRIWNELCQISFFQDVRIDDLGVIYFKMHDLVHDLALSITEQECIYLEDLEVIDPATLRKNTHHLF